MALCDKHDGATTQALRCERAEPGLDWKVEVEGLSGSLKDPAPGSLSGDQEGVGAATGAG